MSNAFSNALALESVGELGIFNAATGTYSGVTHDDLVSYARTVAYKVFHNLKLGHTMSKEDDPLTVDGVSAANVWADHYEFVSENPLCGEWYRVPYPPTDAMKDAWNNDDSNDFNTAYLAMVHASPAAAQFCGKCDKPDDDGPGEEDGPWAEGWEQRSGLPSQARIEFEAWVRGQPFFGNFDFDRFDRDDDDGGYLDGVVHAAWLAWNARGAA